MLNGSPVSTTNAFADWTASLSGLAPGSNTFTVTATDGISPSNTGNTTVTVFRLTDPNADPDGNGLTVLMEHAFAISPGDPEPGLSLPTAIVEQDGGQRYATLCFRRRIGSGDLSYVVMKSSNLQTWEAAGLSAQEISAIPTGDGSTEQVKVRLLPALGPGNLKGYLRLKVTLE